MSEHFSFKECTWFAPNSANYRESHPEYRHPVPSVIADSPKGCHQVQTSAPPSMLNRNVSKFQRTLKRVQKDMQVLKEDREFLKSAPCSPSLHDSSWTCPVPDGGRPLSNHKPPCLKLQPHTVSPSFALFSLLYITI